MRPHDVERELVGTTAKTKSPRLLSTTTTPSSSPSPPQTQLPFLPEELVAEILVRLPVRSLLEFRSVCQSWKTLISSPQFARDHLQRSTMHPTAAHQRLAYSTGHEDDARIGVFSIKPLLENPSAPTRVACFQTASCKGIVGSCNGMLCVRDRFRVRLWNPCTRLASEWFEIENPAKEYLVYAGFGHDHVHDKYKLIVMVGLSWTSVTKLHTLGSNSWTAIDFPVHRYHRPGTFLSASGTLNWIAEVIPYRLMILSFDLATETFGQMSLPRMNDDDPSMPALGVLRGCLSACFEDDKKSSHWAIWLMKEYGVQRSWTKLAMFPREEPPLYRVRWIRTLKPLYVSEDDVVLARSPWSSKLVLFSSNDGRLVYPRIDSSGDGVFKRPMNTGAGHRILHVFHESLVSPSHCGLQSCLFGLTVD